MAGVDKLDPWLRAAVRAGLMTEQQALDADAFGDGLVQRVKDGELTIEQAEALAAKQGTADALAVNRARERKP